MTNNTPQGKVATHKKAYHNYEITTTFESGIVLEGWEVKSIRLGRVQLKESYVVVRRDEIWLLGAHISPLSSMTAHRQLDPQRTRKLLLHQHEIKRLIGLVQRKNYTLVALNMYWNNNHLKVTLALAKGKKLHDKRASLKEREWQREKARSLRET